jgi:hypothetical protein
MIKINEQTIYYLNKSLEDDNTKTSPFFGKKGLAKIGKIR